MDVEVVLDVVVVVVVALTKFVLLSTCGSRRGLTLAHQQHTLNTYCTHKLHTHICRCPPPKNQAAHETVSQVPRSLFGFDRRPRTRSRREKRLPRRLFSLSTTWSTPSDPETGVGGREGGGCARGHDNQNSNSQNVDRVL